MSEFLRDLLKKAKESADGLDAPREAGELSIVPPALGKTSRGLATEPGVPWRDPMGMTCPSCDKHSVVIVNRFRRAGTAIGGTVGAIVGSYAGRAAITVFMSAAGGPLGAVLGAIFGATTGGWSGRKLGKMIDEDMICQYKCLNCKHKFYA